MLKIRLQRIGKRGQAYFKVIVTEHTRKPKGKYLELLGSYDPHKNELTVNSEKVKHWLGQGAKMSATVNNLLVGKNVIEGKKVKAWKPKKKKSSETSAEATPAKEALTAETKPETSEQKSEEPKEEKTVEPSAEVPKEEVKVEQQIDAPAPTAP